MIIGIPFLNRRDMLDECLDSIDIEARVIVIDNGGLCADLPDEIEVIQPPSNLGVAASWNFVIRTTPAEPWWCLLNADTVLASGDLARLATEMAEPGPRWVGMNGDWRVMGVNAECVETVGFFDESFVPIYCEDADYEYRCSLAGVPWYFLDGGATHAGSATIRSDALCAARNRRTYPENVAYYERKWGGSLRGGEKFTTPFDAGGSVRDWNLDLRRLRELAWA